MKSKLFSGTWLFDRTLISLILVLLTTLLVTAMLSSCISAPSVAAGVPVINTEATATKVVKEPTVTKIPTSTLIPTKIVPPSPTPKPENFGWPILQEMPYGEERAEIEASFANDPSLVEKVEEQRFLNTSSWGLAPLLLYVDTLLLLDYTNKSLPDDLFDYLFVWYEGIKFHTGVAPSGDQALFVEGIDDISVSHKLFVDAMLAYEYANSTSRGLCQFFEAATLEGYGVAKEIFFDEPSDIPSGIEFLIERFGDPKIINDENRLYCSNFNPESADFLSIAKAKGYEDIILQVYEKLK